MNPPLQSTCSQCGAPLAAGVPGGLCLRCLLAIGLNDQTGGDAESARGAAAAVTPDVFDRYRVIEKIGEGGCGVVYRAEQLAPVRREVALKVIKLGMDTQGVIARFEAERQALALMDHPHIAKVFDAGATQSGRPFFAMELVRGERITDYCDRQQLSIPHRLELFAQVCQAIQHAHQKGIIHRDIKPSNILVLEQDDKPVPKIIDFGIAKATARQRLAAETVYTAFDQFVGTPAYMSPEQAGLTGEDIDTRSDIYSLGVLLYELLTGRPPFDPERLRQAALGEICRIIREEEPARPSARLTTLTHADLSETARQRLASAPKLVSELRGDLDWLVMKALEKDRARRYATANALAADIQRHLANEPISARPPGAIYRAQKFARRNRTAVVAIAAVALALIAGTIISAVEAIHARRAEMQARNEAATSEQVKQFLERMFNGNTPGRFANRDTTVLREILDEAAQRVERELSGQPDVAAELLMVIANNYRWLGRFEESALAYRQADQFARKSARPDTELRASILESMSVSVRRLGRLTESESLCREALALRRATPGMPVVEVNGSLAYVMLSVLLRNQGLLDEAERLARESLDARRQKFKPGSPDAADALNEWAKVLELRGEFARAEPVYRDALAIHRALAKTDDAMMVSKQLCNLGIIRFKRGALDEAAELLQHATDIDRRIFKGGHTDAIQALATLGQVQAALGHTNEAEASFREAIANDNEARPQWPAMLSSALERYAMFRRHQGDEAGADELGVRAAQVLLQTRSDPSAGVLKAVCYSTEDFARAGDWTNAEARAQLALQLAASGTEHLPFILAQAKQNLAALRWRQGRTAEAAAIVAEIEKLLGDAAVACERGGAEPAYGLVYSLADLAVLLEKQGDAAGADAQFQRAIGLARRLTYANEYILIAFDGYTRYLTAQNRPAEATAVQGEADKLKARSTTR